MPSFHLKTNQEDSSLLSSVSASVSKWGHQTGMGRQGKGAGQKGGERKKMVRSS